MLLEKAADADLNTAVANLNDPQLEVIRNESSFDDFIVTIRRKLERGNLAKIWESLEAFENSMLDVADENEMDELPLAVSADIDEELNRDLIKEALSRATDYKTKAQLH